MTTHPLSFSRTTAVTALCLLALLFSVPVFAQEVPAEPVPEETLPEETLPEEPAYEEEATYEEPAAEATGSDVAATLAADGRFSVLLDALAQTGLDAAIAEGGPFTVFAPTDDAFATLPAGTLEALSDDDLRAVLLYHVVEGEVGPDAATLGEPVATLAGPALEFSDVDGSLVVNGTAAAGEGVTVSNGRVYALGTVLLPPTADMDSDM
ncbi:fasciclin domain-containing protein [Rubrivirga litoralis]|uniref:Fasciclin domain-containing protein n=1 Tax=Rubrivirga litoralis TaxID=3075598 RepID=A0ABU3BSM1_9BACT|nr:fasciclin domain-containing protein [Rubrivirga sp. F394]MDT0632296.1 fasciclin domain-containing protein [Rubrivirga sp. F394]